MLRINNVPVSLVCPILDKTRLTPQLYSEDGIHFYTRTCDKKISLKEEFSLIVNELSELQNSVVDRMALAQDRIKTHGPEEYRFLLSVYNKLKKIV